MPDSSVNLIFTSPPYARFKKEYGNVNQSDYVAWFLRFARHYHRLLKDDGSFVLDIGGAGPPDSQRDPCINLNCSSRFASRSVFI